MYRIFLEIFTIKIKIDCIRYKVFLQIKKKKSKNRSENSENN